MARMRTDITRRDFINGVALGAAAGALSPAALVAARAAIGRISIANSDASALAYVNGAFDAAFRAVDEQLAIKG